MSERSHTATSISPWKRYNILIVDDEVGVRGELQAVLELEGFNVVAAENGEAALARLDEVDPKVVLSDQKMGSGMSGTAFLSEVKRRKPDVVTMVLSAFAEVETIMAAMNEAGAYQYLLKTSSSDEIVDRISKALEFYHVRAEKERLATANSALMRKLAMNESFFMMGDFSTALFERFFPLLREFLRQSTRSGDGKNTRLSTTNDEFRALLAQEKWQELGVVLQKLRLLSSFYQRESKFNRRSIVSVVESAVRDAINALSAAEDATIISLEVTNESKDAEVWVHDEALACAVRAVIENGVLAALGGDSRPQVAVRIAVLDDAQHVLGDEAVSKVNRITDMLSSTGPSICVDVEDTGPGVSPALADKIFSPLFSTRGLFSDGIVEVGSLHDYNMGPNSHVGLGLPLARWCAAQHEGGIRLLNPGESGARFRIALPLDQVRLSQSLG